MNGSVLLRWLYGFLCVAGTLLPMSAFLPWLLANGLDAGLFVGELFSTHIGAFFGWDVIVSALVLIVFVLAEGRRCGVQAPWLPIAATLGVGVSLGLPLFLLLREQALANVADASLAGEATT